MQIGKYRIQIVTDDCIAFGMEIWTDPFNIGHKEVNFKFWKKAIAIQWDFLEAPERSKWLI